MKLGIEKQKEDWKINLKKEKTGDMLLKNPNYAASILEDINKVIKGLNFNYN